MIKRERDLRELCRRHPGWKLTRRRKGWRLIGPHGELVAAAWTPSARSFLRAVEGDLRRAARSRGDQP
jgi:hypothetical protein